MRPASEPSPPTVPTCWPVRVRMRRELWALPQSAGLAPRRGLLLPRVCPCRRVACAVVLGAAQPLLARSMVQWHRPKVVAGPGRCWPRRGWGAHRQWVSSAIASWAWRWAPMLAQSAGPWSPPAPVRLVTRSLVSAARVGTPRRSPGDVCVPAWLLHLPCCP